MAEHENTEKNKKPIYKKAWFWILIALVIIIVMGTTGGENNSNQTNTNVKQENLITNSNNEKLGEGEIGKYYVKIGEHEITRDYSGNPILLVTIDFTNNNDEAKAFIYSLDCKAYQNGVELTSPISTYGIENYNWQDKTKEVQKGVTYQFKLAFEISDETKPVDIQISPKISSKYNQKVIKTIEL